jgi:hypothetical protein
MTATPETPPRPTTRDGQPRRVGVEVEFAGPGCAEVAQLVAELFGGSPREREAYSFEVHGTRYGDFEVELDWSHAHPDKPRPQTAGDDSLGDRVERGFREALGTVGELVMPLEVTSPPLPREALPEMDRLVAGLRGLGAKGTGASPLYAFGLQLNPELAAGDAGYLLDTLRAFLLLEDWLRETAGVDPSRRLTPFVSRFPSGYVHRILDPGYRPDLAGLVDDYLEANPTRNRDLDLLPALAHLDAPRVRRRIDDGLVKARPAFHYRLPDSRVGQAGWGVVADWNRWVRVERLAEDRAALRAASEAFLAQARHGRPSDWAAQWRGR